jgi:hypothetical protein
MLGTYCRGECHAPRCQVITLGLLGGQHAIFDLCDEVDEILDFLGQGGIFGVLGLVGVHGVGARWGVDGCGCSHCGDLC